MPIRPGKSSRLVLIVEPHRGQNIQLTFPPDAPLRVKIELSPRRLMTCSELHRDESENALPERFWHRVQLQAVTIAGSPSTVMLSCPHWQVAVRIASYLLLPSLSENHTASSRLGKPFWLLRLAPKNSPLPIDPLWIHLPRPGRPRRLRRESCRPQQQLAFTPLSSAARPRACRRCSGAPG
jgi:hypothetical protein